jgi:hypothetical protein
MRRSMIIRSESGGAMTEFSLAMIFTIPMLFYTLFLGDTLNISMKAQDAAGAAVWYGSGMQAHDYSSPSQSAHDAKTKSAIQDGCNFVQTNWDNGLYTQGTSLYAAKGAFSNLTCTHHPGDSSVSEAKPAMLMGLMNYDGLVSANIEVDVRNILVPQNTIDITNTYDPSLDPLVFCGEGWATSRTCNVSSVGFYAWYDDWAVNMNSEISRNAKPNGSSAQTNKEMFQLIDNLYGGHTGLRGFGIAVLPIVTAVLGYPSLLDPLDNTRAAYYALPGLGTDTGSNYGANGPTQNVHYNGPQQFNTIHWQWAYDAEVGYPQMQNTRRTGTYYMGRASVP